THQNYEKLLTQISLVTCNTLAITENEGTATPSNFPICNAFTLLLLTERSWRGKKMRCLLCCAPILIYCKLRPLYTMLAYFVLLSCRGKITILTLGDVGASLLARLPVAKISRKLGSKNHNSINPVTYLIFVETCNRYMTELVNKIFLVLVSGWMQLDCKALSV
ncbi:Uncharacterized protein APZ42_006880, partial [Daphnia magna]